MTLEDDATLPAWLDNLGYSAEGEALHQSVRDIPPRHPYARELGALLAPEGSIRAQAVFAADGTPSVVFLNRAGQPYSRAEVDEIRQRIWNQNLASIVVEIKGDSATAFPAGKVEKDAPITLQFNEARPDGVLSARDIQSANLAERKPEWFRRKDRVDHRLITNITELVSKLAELESDDDFAKTKKRAHAQILVGQILFISYLEHREIVGSTYREKRNVGSLHDLIARADRLGVATLIDALKEDFNGDFLSDERHQYWDHLTAGEFQLLNEFLKQTQMSPDKVTFGTTISASFPSSFFPACTKRFSMRTRRRKRVLSTLLDISRFSPSTRPSLR